MASKIIYAYILGLTLGCGTSITNTNNNPAAPTGGSSAVSMSDALTAGGTISSATPTGGFQSTGGSNSVNTGGSSALPITGGQSSIGGPSNVCSPDGISQCSKQVVQTCMSGQWQTVQTCPYGCTAISSGASCTGTCIPGDIKCPLVCDATGKLVRPDSLVDMSSCQTGGSSGTGGAGGATGCAQDASCTGLGQCTPSAPLSLCRCNGGKYSCT